MKKKTATADQKKNAKLKEELNQNREKLKAMKEKLRERNAEFKNELVRFDDSVTSKSESFQREFNYDMGELDKTFKNIFKNNAN